MRVSFLFVLMTATFAPAVNAQQISVVSSANNQPTISPNSLATIYGANLAQGAAPAQLDSNGALPTSILGTSVSIGGKAAQLLYVSPQQINFLTPAGTALGTASVSVTSPTSETAITGTASVAAISPGLFTIPCVRPSRGAVENGVTFALEPFQSLTPQNAIADKRTRLSFYGTGLRYAGNPTLDSGTVNVASAVTAQATTSLGITQNLPVEYAGPSPVYPGLDQVNVVVPAQLEGAGLVNVQMFSGNAASNSVSIVMSPSLEEGLGSGQSFNISTVAGSGAAGESGDGSSALAASLGQPSAIVLDKQHNLYIADPQDHVVRVVSTDGVIRTFAGTGTAGSSGDGGLSSEAQLSAPTSLATDSSGNIYIADPGNNNIRRVGPDGTISTFAGTGSQGFSGDGGLATSAQLSSPNAVAVDPFGAVEISDSGNNRIRKVTSDGIIETIAGTGSADLAGDGGSAYSASLNAPDSIAIGADGTTYIADEGNQRIRRIAPDGSISSLLNPDSTPLALNGAIRLAVDANQQLVVSNSQNSQVQTMGAACQLTTAAGNGMPGFAGDGGPAITAQLSSPAGLAADASGDVYVADAGNNRIRRLYQGNCDSPATIFFDPAPAISGMTVDGLVRLACPATQETALALSSNIGGLQLPSTVSIAPGQTTGAFSFAAPDVAATTGYQVSASNPAESASGTTYIAPAGSPANALSLSVTPQALPAGIPATGVFRLASPAPSGGTRVFLTSNSPAATVASNANVPQGQTSAEFSVATSPVMQPTTATISGNAGGANANVSLSLVPQGLATIAGVTISPSTISAGQTATGTVTLASPAPAGGASVNLSSDNSAASVPSSIAIPQGQTSGTFPVATSAVTTPTTATVNASSANGASASLQINPTVSSPPPTSATIASLSISPSSVTGGQNATGAVTLAAAAPSGGVQVGLTSSNSAATVPASVTIPAGQTTANFPVSTSTVSSANAATISASSANTQSATLTVNPSSPSSSACVGNVSLSRSEVIGGNSVSGTVALTTPAPQGGQPVSLSSSSSSASVPAQVTVPAGQSSTGFTVTTTPVLSTQNPVISASTGACAGSNAGLTVLPENLP